MFSNKQKTIALVSIITVFVLSSLYNVNSINNYSVVETNIEKTDTLYLEIVYLQFEDTKMINYSFVNNVSEVNDIFENIDKDSTNLRVVSEKRLVFNNTLGYYADNDNDTDYSNFFSVINTLDIPKNTIFVYDGVSKTYDRNSTGFYDLYNTASKTVLISFQSTNSVLAHEIFHILKLEDQYVQSASYDIMDSTAHSGTNNLQFASQLKLGWDTEYNKIDDFVVYSEMQLKVGETIVFERYGLFIEYNQYLESMYAYTYLRGISYIVRGSYYNNNDTFYIHDFQGYNIEITLNRDKGTYRVVISDYSQLEINTRLFIFLSFLIISLVAIDVYYKKVKNKKEISTSYPK